MDNSLRIAPPFFILLFYNSFIIFKIANEVCLLHLSYFPFDALNFNNLSGIYSPLYLELLDQLQFYKFISLREVTKNNNIYINDYQKDKIIKYIYDPIITECNKQNIQNTLKLLLNILKQFKFNKEQQTIELDQNIIQKIDTRMIKKGTVNEYWKELIQNIKGESSFIIENVIISKIKHLIFFFEYKRSSSINDDKEMEVVKQLKSFQDKYKKIFEKKAQNIIQQQFENTLNKQMENYKFDIDEEEKTNILNSLLNRILNMKLNKYFQNSPHYLLKIDSNQILQYQLNLITKLSQPIIIEEVELLIDFKYQMIIDELI
ncbi:unnamed protein product [Paramecium pentaurelia]|uniref:Uncharacterized protein n=1 Tax=Paramecium pentaurelia TaxID=43138 RepID=A0A8S1WIK8_9CILI|nr:unnamed protein product [Paramecium pentaurelia]